MRICRSIPVTFIIIFSLFFSPLFLPAVKASVGTNTLSDHTFLTAEDGIYGASLQKTLQGSQSPLALYKELIGGQSYTAGDLIWIASQQRDYGLNPRVLLTTLEVLQGLQTIPQGELSPLLSDMSASLWANYLDYQAGQRTVPLDGGQSVTIETSLSGASFALAKYLGPKCENEAALRAYLEKWSESYHRLFDQDPLASSSLGKIIPVVVPFLRLPFNQPKEGFFRVNSFFDHQAPRTFDDYLMRFDGKGFSSASFNNCALRVNCYGGHNALDYSIPLGTPIYASAAGTVVYKYFNKDSSQGEVDSGLIIDHGNGYRTLYWHQDEIYVKLGDSVTQGQQLGVCGNVGKSSGAHLHYGLRRTEGSKDVDPYGWWSSSADPWGDSFWAWQGDGIADMGEAQSQLFYGSYWYREARGYNNESWWTMGVTEPASSTNWGMWGTFISTPGEYKVYAYWPKDSEATTSATYTVFQGSKGTPVTVNQAAGGDSFFLLGTFSLNKGNAVVILNDLTKDKLKRVYFDAIKWELASSPSTQTPVGPGTYDDGNSHFMYSPGWQPVTSSGSYNNTSHTSGTIGEYANLMFTGTKASLIFSQDPGNGGMKVDIDCVYLNSPVMTSTAPVYQKRWDSPDLPYGTYTITFTHDSGKSVNIDAVIISP